MFSFLWLVLNFGKYDIYSILKEFFMFILLYECDMNFVFKKLNNFMCLIIDCLCFLDVVNFLVFGFSYDVFLRLYRCILIKGFFFYEWFDLLDKLKYLFFLLYDVFYVNMCNENIIVDDYVYC